MESQKAPIKLYAKRSFGDKMNASFDFIKENWKPLLKFITYLMLPLSLLQALSLNGFMSQYMGLVSEIEGGNSDTILSALPQLGTTYGLTLLCYWVGAMLIASLVYGLMKAYGQRPERLVGITLTELKPLLMHNLGAMFRLSLFTFLLLLLAISLVIGLAVLTPFTLIVTLPLLFALVVPLSLYAPIYLFEDIHLMDALSKTFRLGFATWGGVFLITLLMGIIGGILQGVIGTPWTVAVMVKQLFSMSDTGDAVTVSVGYNFVIYLFAILQCYGSYLGMTFTLVGAAYQYGHASEVVDSISIESDIENFDKL